MVDLVKVKKMGTLDFGRKPLWIESIIIYFILFFIYNSYL